MPAFPPLSQTPLTSPRNQHTQKRVIQETDREWLEQSHEVAPFSDEPSNLAAEEWEFNDKVTMRSCAEAMDIDEPGEYDNVETVNPSDDDYDEEEAERKENRWESAARTPAKVPSGQGKDLDMLQSSSPFKDGSEKRGFQNTDIEGSKMHNRTFVTRQGGKSSHLGFFKHSEEDELVYEGKMLLKDRKKQLFDVDKMQQHRGGNQLLFLTPQKTGALQLMDLHKGKVIEEWEAKEEGFGAIEDIAPTKKHGDTTDNPLVYGITDNSMFTMDGRVNNKNKVVTSKQYARSTKTGFGHLATTGQGFLATASDNGNIRLYDTLGKKAKTLLPGLGDAITAIETSDDGKWILATCKDYIMVIPTTVPGGDRLGYAVCLHPSLFLSLSLSLVFL